MSDFWSTFRFREDEEEDQLQPQIGPPQRADEGFNPFRLREEIAEGRQAREPEFERTFMDRIFAPFEAPQQALFSFTRSVNEEGFGISSIWEAISHGMNYFNPFSNTERILPHEIREAFGMRVDPEERRTWQDSAMDLVFSIFYDPLWLLPPLAAAKKAGKIGATTAHVASRVVNPGALIGDAAREGTNRILRPGLRAGAKALGREREYLDLTTKMTQTFVKRFAGVPEAVHEKMVGLETRVREWAGLGAKTVRNANKLSPKTRKLLAEAIESDAVYERVIMGGPLPRRKQADFDRIIRQLDVEGIDKELFWQVYQQVQGVEMGLGESLLKAGLLPYPEFAELHGRHLRKYYQAFENPGAALERVDALLSSGSVPARYKGKSMKLFDQVELRKQLEEAASFMDQQLLGTTVPGPTGTRQPQLFAPGAAAGVNFQQPTLQRYFPAAKDGSRRFHVDNFLEDFGDFLIRQPDSTLAEAMQHVTQNMLGGATLPPQFTTQLQNYLAKGQATIPGLLSWKEKFSRGSSPAVQFREWRSQMEQLAKRQNIPELIRKEVLGEITDVSPRLARDISRGARQLEVNKFFDELSGAQRVDHQTAQLASRVRGSMRGSQADPQEMNRLLGHLQDTTGITDEQELMRIANRLIKGSLKETDVLLSRGSDWATLAKTDVNTYQLPASPSLGSLSEMWVRPSLSMHLNQYARAADLATDSNRAKGIMTFITDMMAKTTGQFKFMKIVADPGANFRDTVGTLMMLDVTTGLPFNVGRLKNSFLTARAYMRGDTNFYTDLARSVGYKLMDSGFTGAELARIADRRDLFRQAWDTDLWKGGPTLFQRFTEAIGRGQSAIAQNYQLRENMFRTYVFSSTYDDLAGAWVKAGKQLTPDAMERFAKQAAAKTDQALFNYADVPYAVEWARRYGAAPFLTFPLKAGQQLVSTLMERPHRVLRYDRGIAAWNTHHAGSPEEFAREIAALPDHKRRALVVRLPGEDVDGNPMYLDLSYFLPWYAIKDMAEDVAWATSLLQGEGFDPEDDSARRRLAGDMGMRSSVISPILFQIYDAIRHGRDGLGRELWKETDDFEARVHGISKWVYQFMTPPTAPGGVTADSVGRAMLAMARTSDEPMDWVEALAPRLRDPLGGFGDQFDVLNRYGERPTSRALVGADSTIFGDTENRNANLAINAASSLFLNVTASDPSRQARAERTQVSVSNTEIHRQIAQVRRNVNMSPEQKQEEITRLTEMLIRNQRIAADRIRAMF